MLLRVFGSGCERCKELRDLTVQAATELGLDYELVDVTDPKEIAECGVMMTPALAMDNYLVVMGQVPSIERLKDILSTDFAAEEEKLGCGGDCAG